MYLKLLIILTLVYSCTTNKNNSKTSSSIKQETFWAYYKLCNIARDSFSKKNYIAASALFDQAIRSVERPFWQDLQKAIETELILNNISSVKNYSSALASTYALYPYKKYFDTIQINYNEFIKEYTPIIEQTKKQFNQQYIAIIDSLFYIDQSIRTSGKFKDKNGKNIDSLNTHCLLKSIERFGFPSAHKVGIKSYNYADIIFTHADFDFDNFLLGDLLYLAVEQGDYTPKQYASIIDRRCNFHPSGSKPYVYFQIPLGYEDLSETEKKEVQKRRKAIGLRSIESSLEIVKLPNGDIKIIPIN